MVSKSEPNKSDWVTRGTILPVSVPPAGAINLNVQNRLPTSPVEGFGALRLRTYRVSLQGINLSPAKIMDEWKSRFSNFWPEGNHFFTSNEEIAPGVTGWISLTLPGGIHLYTGAVVMFVGDESFSLMTLQGHMFSGWITFSSYLEEGMLYAQTQALIRPNDPLYELMFILGIGSHAEDEFWHSSLLNLACNFGIESKVTQVNRTIDRSLQWRYFKNLWYNAAIRSVLYQLTMLFRKRLIPERHERSI